MQTTYRLKAQEISMTFLKTLKSKFAGKEVAQNYIIREVAKPYELQGSAVARKHIEVIVKQMFSRRKVRDAGGTELSRGDIVEAGEFELANRDARERGVDEAKADQVLMGITEVSLSRKSFLSAASFQHTTRILIAAAIRGVLSAVHRAA